MSVEEIKIINTKRIDPKYLKHVKYHQKSNPIGMNFNILNTRPSVVNGLRRTIGYEMDMFVLSCKRKHFDTDDDFIIFEEIKNKIEMIKIKQISNMSFYIDLKNNTDEIIDVYYGDIKEYKNSGEELFRPDMVLTNLNPGKYLKIDNIKPILGNSETASTRHQINGNLGYECLDLRDYKDTPSSMVMPQKNYKITIRPQGYFHPTDIIRLATKTIINRIENIQKILIENKNNETFSTKKIILEKEKENFYIYTLMNETNTIGNLISEMVREDNGSFITFQHEHQEDSHIFIKLRTSKNPNNIILPSLKKLIEEFKTINKSFIHLHVKST